ncbi:MAG: hypothetical protein KIT11_00745 [Fimbriimonadaceae bacterium]|nr:hypothetical protein [Fimbriimonadaceae bacterium]QYK55099.1 MAG: hypothetical protein KF733_08790 [Fimbriimonadaceae bacterium]
MISVAAVATFVALRKRAKGLDVDTLIDACDRAADALEEVLFIPRRQAS